MSSMTLTEYNKNNVRIKNTVEQLNRLVSDYNAYKIVGVATLIAAVVCLGFCLCTNIFSTGFFVGFGITFAVSRFTAFASEEWLNLLNEMDERLESAPGKFV